MKSFGISLTTKSPLMLSAGPPARNLLDTLDFIPGNTIRGVLARRYLEKSSPGSPADDDFKALFLTGDAVFGFASVNGAQRIPLSARTCKYEGGFKMEGGHGIVDLVLHENAKRCCPHPECNNPLDYLEGFWSPLEGCRKDVCKRLIVRTAIDSARASASMGKLYSNQVIGEEMIFLGEIEVPDELQHTLDDLLAEPFTAGIGTGRSRGQGWVEVGKITALPSLNWESAESRFKRFQDAGSHCLVVTLLSDGIFTDDYLRERTAPSIMDIAPLGINPAEWDSVPSSGFAATRTVFGFDGPPLHLPRIPRLAVAAGSVFIFKPKKDHAALTPFSGDGLGWIGKNNREGFGKAVLWHPFHISPEEWKWSP